MKPLHFPHALALAIVPLVVQAKLYESLESLPNGNYDFIIIGGGTAGSVVASRLTESHQVNALLVEAGPNNEGVLDIQVPGFLNRVNRTYNWNYVTEPLSGLNNRTLEYSRGHVLGGSSSINGMIYTRGARGDYDASARITDDSGWTWKSLIPFIKRHEKWVHPLGGRNITGQYDPRVHGNSGNVLVSLATLGPFFLSHLAWNQNTFGNGERSSSATAYLNSQVRRRANLDIVTNTLATRLLPVLQEGSGRRLDIGKVELAPKPGGNKEVVLSGGTINNPQILLSSGIGNRTELNAVGITTIHDLPDVGKGLSDHHVVLNVWNATGIPPPQPGPEALDQWKANRTGPLSGTPFSGRPFIWTRIPSNSSIFEEYGGDPSSGSNAPHLEIIPGVKYKPDEGSQVLAVVFLLTPKSQALRIGVSRAVRFFGTPAWSDYVTELITPNPDTTPREIFNEAFIRGTAGSALHPTGTARMSAKHKLKEGVVDPDLKVKGVKGLRIVDASVIPLVPTGHTQAPVYILAERAADLIRDTYRSM